MKVAVVGGTGSFGKALARRLAEADYEVVIGSRGAERAADLVVLATKAEAAVDTARELRDAIGATPVLSVAAELSFVPEGVVPTPDARSVAARVQEVVAGPVVAGLHSLAARNLGRDEPPEEDVLVCGDDADGKQLVVDLASRITSGRAVDCGPLASARALEGLTAVIVNVNKRYKAHAGVRLTGIP